MPLSTCGAWKVAESGGYLWDNVALGVVLATNVFFNLAVLRLATHAAGCRVDDADCDRRIYALKPSSFLTTVITVGQLSAVVAMPFVGAAVDYTSWRRAFGSATAWTLCTTTPRARAGRTPANAFGGWCLAATPRVLECRCSISTRRDCRFDASRRRRGMGPTTGMPA